jgi:hypothetical protein
MEGFLRHLIQVFQSLYAGTNIIIENGGTRSNRNISINQGVTTGMPIIIHPFLSLFGPRYDRMAGKCRFFKK